MLKWALIALFSVSTVLADEVSLHLFRSPLGINWKTPWSLATSTLLNQVAPVGDKRAFSISHVFVEVKCDSTGEHIFRGMTSATTTEERDLLFRQKYGLGIMFHTYKGLYEKDQAIIDDMTPYEGSKRKAILTYKISPSTCERLIRYANEYEQLGYGNMYSGLQADPLKREGAGCSAFAVSFLRVGGLMSGFEHEWQQTINVPKRLVGGPLTGAKVNLSRIIARPGIRWNKSEPHIPLTAWDPELMHKWVQKTYWETMTGNFSSGSVPQLERVKDTLTVIFDFSDRETPTGDFWIR